MNNQADKIQRNKNQPISNDTSHKKHGSDTFQFLDNRPEAVTQRKLKNMANDSPKDEHISQLQSMTNADSDQQEHPIQEIKNKTGLPDNLKSGIENLSGYSMDDVKVHYNSDKPAQLQAHAYAQGADIHLGSGQEKHLPHEAWHVVQQKQGRVQPTTQLKGGLNINDDSGLEKEADVMGEKALQMSFLPSGRLSSSNISPGKLYQRNPAIQRAKFSDEFAPSKMIGWIGGKTLRGAADIGAHAAISIGSKKALDYAGSKAVELGSQSAINELVEMISPLLVPGAGMLITAISIASKVAAVLERIVAFWQHLSNEARVFIYYLAGSFQGWVFGEKNISDYLIGDGEIDQEKITALAGKLKTVGTISQMPVEAVKGAASWAVASTTDYAKSWADTAASYSGSALKMVGGYFWGANVGEGLSSGFKNEEPPFPEALQESVKKLKEVSEGKAEAAPEEVKETQDENSDAKNDGKSKLPATPLREISIGPLNFGLFKLSTERGGQSGSGGLVVDAGFQIDLFENKFPESLKPFVRVSIPWFLRNYSILPKMGMVDPMGNTYSYDEEESNKVMVQQLQPINISINKNFGIVNVGTLTIKDTLGNNDGVQSSTLDLDYLRFASDSLNLSNLSAQWNAANGVTFKTGASFKLKDKEYFSATANLTIDQTGKFSEGGLNDFIAPVLPAPLDKLTVTSASFDKECVKVISAELMFKEGYGLKKVTLENLVVDKNGNYDLNAKTTFEGMKFLNDQLEFGESTLDLGISSKEGWTIKGDSKLKVGSGQKDMSAKGNVTITYNNNSRDLNFDLMDGEIHLSLFESSLKVDGTEITYKDGKFTIGKGDIVIDTALFPKSEGSITELAITKEGVDWKNAEASVQPFDLWGLKIDKTTANVAGKERGHSTTISGGLGVEFGDYFGFKGTGGITYNPSTKDIYLDEANTNILGKADLPGSLLPFWPIKLTIFIPIVPGLEAHGGIEVDGGVQLSYEGDISKKTGNPSWVMKSDSKNKAFLKARIKAGLTAGSGYLIGLSGSLFAGVDSEANANMKIGGSFIFDGSGLDMKESTLTYDLSALLLARIGAEISGVALGIFHKKLYKVEKDPYEIGKYEFNGTTTFSPDGKLKHVDENPKFQGVTARAIANEPKYSIVGEDKKVQEMLLDAKANIIDVDGLERKKILSKLTVEVSQQASSLLHKQMELKSIFDNHMKQLMEIIIRKDVYFMKHVNSPGIEEKLEDFDKSHELTKKKDTIREQGHQLDRIEGGLNKILKIMNDVETEINQENLEKSSGDKGDRVNRGQSETRQIGTNLEKINTNISFSGIQEDLTELGADALTVEVSSSIMTLKTFKDISTTTGLFGGENERKRVNVVDDLLAEYDLLRSRPKDVQLSFLKNNLLPKVIEYSKLKFSSRTEASLLLKYQIEQAILKLSQE